MLAERLLLIVTGNLKWPRFVTKAPPGHVFRAQAAFLGRNVCRELRNRPETKVPSILVS